MNFKIEKSVLIKLLIIGVVLIISPYAVPFSIELMFMADLMGLEALVLFMIYQARHVITAMAVRFHEWRNHAAAVVVLLANAYVFKPRIFFGHVAGSSLVLIFACSTLMAFALWVPAIYLSGGGFV